MQTGLSVGISTVVQDLVSPLSKAGGKRMKNPLDASSTIRAKGALSHMQAPLTSAGPRPSTSPLRRSAGSSPLRAKATSSGSAASKYRRMSSPLQNAAQKLNTIA